MSEIHDQRVQSIFEDEPDSLFLLAEYNTLRQEILNLQQFTHQINTLGYTIGAAIGAVIAIAEKTPCDLKAIVMATVMILYFCLILSQIFRRRKIYWIGRYIEFMIEARVPDLYWETAWDRHKRSLLSTTHEQLNNMSIIKRTLTLIDKTIIPEEPGFIEIAPLMILQTLAGLGGAYYLGMSEISWLVKFGFFVILILLYVIFIILERQYIHRSDECEEYENYLRRIRLDIHERKSDNRSDTTNSKVGV